MAFTILMGGTGRDLFNIHEGRTLNGLLWFSKTKFC